MNVRTDLFCSLEWTDNVKCYICLNGSSTSKEEAEVLLWKLLSWILAGIPHMPCVVKASPATGASVARPTLTENQTTHSVELDKV